MTERKTGRWSSRLAVALTALASLLMTCVASALADGTLERDLAAITAHSPSRALASDGHEKTLATIEARISALPGVQLQKHTFEMMVPATSKATLTLAGRDVPVYPFVPAHTRLNTTPAGGITGRLVYVGDCEYEQIKPKLLDGQIAVVEPTAAARFLRAFSFGAKAVIVLPDGNEASWMRLKGFEVRTPANLPRFYLEDTVLADQLRAQAKAPMPDYPTATLVAQGDWQPRSVRNLYAFVPGADPLPAGGTPAMTFIVPTEGTSLVVDRAPGVSQAVNVAAALEMLDRFTTEKPRRPVLFIFTSGDSVQYRGTREMFLALAEAPQTWRDEIGTDTDLETLSGKRAGAARDLETLRSMTTGPWAGISPVKDASALQRAARCVETTLSLGMDRLFILRLRPESILTEADRTERQTLEEQQVTLSLVRAALLTDLGLLNDDTKRKLALGYVQQAITQLEGNAESPGLIAQLDARRADLDRRIELYQWLAKLTGRNANPGTSDTKQRLIDTLIGIDLSDRGVRVGPAFQGNFLKNSSKSQIDRNGFFATITSDLIQSADNAKDGKPPVGTTTWFGSLASVIDLTPLSTPRTQASFNNSLALPTELALSWGVPGLSFVTLDDLRATRDTPNDTRVDLPAIRVQMDALEALLMRAVNEPKFVGQPGINRQRQLGFTGMVVSAALGKPVPDLPRSGFLVSYTTVLNTNRIPGIQWISYNLAMRRTEVRRTNVMGEYRFEGFSRLSSGDALNKIMMQAYRQEPGTGRINAASDMGRISQEITPHVTLKDTTINPVRLIPFNCDEVTLVGLYDPRYLQGLGEMTVLDARRNSEPQKVNVTLADQIMAAFVEPSARNYLLFRYGRIGNRLVLLNMPLPGADPKDLPPGIDPARAKRLGEGYTVAQLREIGPLALATSEDFSILDGNRLKNYRDAGVSSALIDDLHGKSLKQIEAGKSALHDDSKTAADVVREANGAWANRRWSTRPAGR
ncbi:MAG: hypothetical protein QM770_03430 [Tepidisphaeraceae bacterium]